MDNMKLDKLVNILNARVLKKICSGLPVYYLIKV